MLRFPQLCCFPLRACGGQSARLLTRGGAREKESSSAPRACNRGSNDPKPSTRANTPVSFCGHWRGYKINHLNRYPRTHAGEGVLSVPRRRDGQWPRRRSRERARVQRVGWVRCCCEPWVSLALYPGVPTHTPEGAQGLAVVPCLRLHLTGCVDARQHWVQKLASRPAAFALCRRRCHQPPDSISFIVVSFPLHLSYIFGGNAAGERMEMTTPVFTRRV